MANSFRIPDSAYDGFDALIRIDSAQLVRLAEHVQQEKLTLDVPKFVSTAAQVTGASEEDLEQALDEVLIPLSGLRAEFRMSSAKFVEHLTELIADQNPEWHEANQEAWARVSSALASLLGPDTFVAQLNKAYRLLVNRPALVDTIRLFTELRPVYDEEATSIKAYLITSTMSVSYSEFGDQKRVHLTFDKTDLERLKEQAERALRKIELLEKQVALLEVPSLVAGTDRS